MKVIRCPLLNSFHRLTLVYPSFQMFGAVESSVTMKLKGTSRSRLRESEAALLPVPEWSHLYNRVWDVADYGEFRLLTQLVHVQIAVQKPMIYKEMLI